MKKVFLLVGFNNWGKTRLIKDLFGRGSFPRNRTSVFGKTNTFPGYDFCVLPNSNDDMGKNGYEVEADRKMTITQADYVFSAFCPTMEPINLSADIIATLYKNDKIVLIPIEYKWCNHAKLELSEIKKYYGNIPNLSIEPLLGNNLKQKLLDLDAIVKKHLP